MTPARALGVSRPLPGQPVSPACSRSPFRRAVDDRLVPGYATVARQLGVSRQRISMLIRLTFLAPDLQHQILGLTTIKGEQITEREVFAQVAGFLSWRDQRAAWKRMAAPSERPQV